MQSIAYFKWTGFQTTSFLQNAGLTSVNNAGLVMPKPKGCDQRHRHRRAVRKSMLFTADHLVFDISVTKYNTWKQFLRDSF